MAKKVGVILDHADLERGKGAGLGRYATLMVDGLGSHRNEVQLSALRRKGSASASFDVPEINPRRTEMLSKVIGLWYLGLPWGLRGEDIDIVHNPFQMPTCFHFEQRYVFTVHDLIPFLFPEVHTARTLVTQRPLTGRTLASADAVLAVSENTKRDLLRLFKLPEEKVQVVHTAVSGVFQPQPEERTTECLARLGIRRPYFLFVGTLEPRKNVTSIVKAFYEVRKSLPDAQLVIGGKKGWGYEGIFETIDAMGIGSSVKYLGHTVEQDLVSLYNGAVALVYPSLYEGFGLPPAEAMACGTPAIVSNTSSLPEVVGEAGIQVDPGSSDQIASAMLRLATEESFRAELSLAGRQRAQRFSVERLGDSLARVYSGL
jgi:glycosyltransferase involved in cell wall biosynthesis